MLKTTASGTLAGALIASLLVVGAGCSNGGGSASDAGKIGSGGGGSGGMAGAGGGIGQGTGGSGGSAGTSGSGGSAGSGGSGMTGGTGGDRDAAADSDGSANSDASADNGSRDVASDATGAVDAINGTPDGGPYSRATWTATSMPPYPTGVRAMQQDLKYSNAFDGDYRTRWSTGDTTSPAQTIGDQFTFDMKEPHVFRKILFWAGGLNGVNGPDSRDYPGALDVSVSLDCSSFGPTVGSGMEPQPGCSGGATCNMPFVINLAQPATARCVRLTLTKRLQLGGGIWWGISELFVYP